MDLKQLVNLLSDHEFKLELKAYRSAYQRLKTRIRNNPFTGQLKQLANMSKLLQKTYSIELLKSYNNKLLEYKYDNMETKDKDKVKKRQNIIKMYLKFLNHMIILIDKLIDKTLQVYAQTQPRLRVGHLVHHYLIVKTSLARLRICFKALLIYSCDLYIDIYTQYKYRGKCLPDCNSIVEILIKNNCKPKIDHSNINKDKLLPSSSTSCDLDREKSNDKNTATSSIKNVTEEEVIGQLIDRNTMKPMVEQQPQQERKRENDNVEHRQLRKRSKSNKVT